MHRFAMAALALLLLLGMPAVARAETLSAEQLMLLKLFGPGPIAPTVFAPAFLAQISMPQVEAVFAHTRATIGPTLSVEPRGAGYVVHTATFDVPVDLALDSSGRIAALLLHPPVQNFAGIDDVLHALDALPGRLSYLVTRNGEVLDARAQTVPLAASSGFKLAVLAAVADEIAAGRLHWDTVVTLAPGEISLPPGQLQTLPAGSPLTVHTLAAFMIAQSDDTATDALMDLVGRDKVAQKLGVDFALKTGEFFKLKADPARRLRFAGADAAAKLAMAGEMAALPLPDAADTGAPLDPGIEWYVSAGRLCGLMHAVAGLDVFSINPGVASKADWAHIAFKGGSEVGVASLTSQVTGKTGDQYCVAVIWNADKPLDEEHFTSLYGSLLAKLAGN